MQSTAAVLPCRIVATQPRSRSRRSDRHFARTLARRRSCRQAPAPIGSQFPSSGQLACDVPWRVAISSSARVCDGVV